MHTHGHKHKHKRVRALACVCVSVNVNVHVHVGVLVRVFPKKHWGVTCRLDNTVGVPRSLDNTWEKMTYRLAVAVTE